MGSLFRAPKIPAYAPSPAIQQSAVQATQAQETLSAQNEADALAEEERKRREREAFAAGLRGSRALLTAGGAGFSLPSTFGGR